jgi:hypothetical protein
LRLMTDCVAESLISIVADVKELADRYCWSVLLLISITAVIADIHSIRYILSIALLTNTVIKVLRTSSPFWHLCDPNEGVTATAIVTVTGGLLTYHTNAPHPHHH